MRGLFQRFASFLKSLFFKQFRGDLRLMVIVSGLFIITFFHLLLGLVLLLHTHYSIVKVDRQIEADLRTINDMRKDLINLPSSKQQLEAPLFNQIDNLISPLSENIRSEQSWKLLKASVDELIKVNSEPKKGHVGRDIEEQLVKCRVLIDDLNRILIEKRQSSKEKLLSQTLIFEAGWILIILFLIGIGTIYLIKTLGGYRRETLYFENLALHLKNGRFDYKDFTYPGRYLTELNQALVNYLKLTKERYQSVRELIKNLNFQTNEISLFSKQNETIYQEVNNDLERIVTGTYRQFDKYQVLDQQIKSLNINLGDSQQQIFDLHSFLTRAVQVFQGAPRVIEEIDYKVKKREMCLKEGINYLFELRTVLERLLQTGSIFQNVAEQNTLLALNASIEAARVETAVGGFDLAAVEIARLAEKIGRVSKELLTVADLMGVKGKAALKTLEIDLARNNNLKNFIETIGNKIKIFCVKMGQFLEEAIQYSIMIEELEEKRKSLEGFTDSLAQLNQRTQNNYGRAEAAIEVIRKSNETSVATERLDLLISEIKQLMNKITV